jgi:hypothetical protein
MNTALVGRVTAFAAILALAAPAAAIEIGGGGSKSTDCLVTFDVDANFPGTAPKQVRCMDGDMSCDDDGVVNGICSLRIRVCANSTFSPDCTLSGVSSINIDHAADNGDPKFDPDFLALRSRIGNDFMFPVTSPDTCTSMGIIQVPIKGPLGNNHCSARKKKLKVHSVSTGASGAKTDTDTVLLVCDPATTFNNQPIDGCDPVTLFGNNTFDRIQKQVFNQNCALSGCHDSQSQTGGLLLETGASYNNLVGVVPSKQAAIDAGWLRIDPGSPETSFLFRKIEGDLPDADYGERMPRGRPKLPKTLRDIIRLWIEAGAPPTGLVPGTY